jgi:hypothetical protein
MQVEGTHTVLSGSRTSIDSDEQCNGIITHCRVAKLALHGAVEGGIAVIFGLSVDVRSHSQQNRHHLQSPDYTLCVSTRERIHCAENSVYASAPPGKAPIRSSHHGQWLSTIANLAFKLQQTLQQK